MLSLVKFAQILHPGQERSLGGHTTGCRKGGVRVRSYGRGSATNISVGKSQCIVCAIDIRDNSD